MKKLIVTTLIFAFVILIAPHQSYAAWWNPLSWFSRNRETQVQEQKQIQETAPTPESQTQDTDNSKTIEDLRSEIATLKASLDNLYTAHTNLVNDHNALLEYTKTIAASNKNTGATNISSNLESRVTSLEWKLNDVCAQIFSSISGLTTNKCPSPRFLIQETLEYRIKKLEGGY